MIVKNSLWKAFVRFIPAIFPVILVLAFSGVYANNLNDTSKKTLLASAGIKPGGLYINKESNVIFPDILKGNETEMLDYIENFSNKRRDYLIRMYTKGKQLLPKAATILKKYNLPEELRVLLTLESAYNANAVSKAGAVGYWQIMDEVAKEYGLKYANHHLVVPEKKKISRKNAKKAEKAANELKLKALAKQKDDRKNFNKSTLAAARYLRDRRLNLNDNWLLVVASYNCGVGNVWNAIEKSGKENPSFWDVKKFLPAETRAYVMNFITLNVIFHNYDKFIKNNLVFNAEKLLIPDNFEQNMSEAIAESTGCL